jgi:hypothetical protein
MIATCIMKIYYKRCMVTNEDVAIIIFKCRECQNPLSLISLVEPGKGEGGVIL